MSVDLDRVAVSPKFTARKLQNATIDEKIDVFEDQVNGWIFSHAEVLVSEQNPHYRHCGIAVLMIVSSYFESIASFMQGESSKSKSEKHFGLGFESVFPEVRKAAEEEDQQNAEKILSEFLATFYSELRCGLFHEAMVRGKIVIRHCDDAVGIVINRASHELATIVIDPSRLLRRVEAHFASYIGKLREPNERDLRTNFEKAWDERLSRPGAVLPEQWLS